MASELFVRKKKTGTVRIKVPEDTVTKLDVLRERVRSETGDVDFNFDAVMAKAIDKVIKDANRYLDNQQRAASGTAPSRGESPSDSTSPAPGMSTASLRYPSADDPPMDLPNS